VCSALGKWCRALNDESFQAARNYLRDRINARASNTKTTSWLGDDLTELCVDREQHYLTPIPKASRFPKLI
jgi:hypothetical protein